MHAARRFGFWMVFGFGIMAASNAQAAEAVYTLDNVILDDGNVPMTGSFTWTYTVGDFENGTGLFTYLDIPYTWHNEFDLNASFDMSNSIEITLEGSVHDDGVDITLFLLQPLTPTTSSALDLVRSKYEIGGNGFHDGAFVSGDIVLVGATDVGDGGIVVPPANRLTIYPNPFNPLTTVSYFVTQPGHVQLSIHDMAGRLVTTLFDELAGAGDNITTWNGRDATGTEVASGIYFVRIEASNELLTRKITLVK